MSLPKFHSSDIWFMFGGGAGRHNKSQSSQQVVAILRTRPVGDDMISRDAQGSMVLPKIEVIS